VNLIDVANEFGTEEQCLAYLERLRWPDGVRCVVCGSDRISRITSSSRKQKIRRLFQCLEPTCKHQFTATAGTIFHDSHLPLQKWFLAITLIVDAKKGMSASQLSRHLHVNYRTAWYLAHRIRKAMEEDFQLFGVVEVDDTRVGGKSHHGEGPFGNKQSVVGMRQRGGKLKFVHTPNIKAATLYNVIHKHINGAVNTIVTDEAVAYQWAMGPSFAKRHKTVCHKLQFVKGDIHTNHVETAFSLFKRGLIGSFHRISVKHLSRYLHEFEYRWNHRKDPMFTCVLRNLTRQAVMPYKELIADTETQA
jgi:transposase-like protein